MTFLLCVLSVYGALYAWFRTHLLLEYGQALGLARWMQLAEWQAMQKPGEELSYVTFMRARWGIVPVGVPCRVVWRAFAVRMLTCHACLGFWLALLASAVAGQWWACLAVYGAAMILYARV